MKKISSLAIQRMALLTAACFAQVTGQLLAQQPAAPLAPKTPAGFVNFINATGLSGEVQVEFQNKPDHSPSVALGAESGMIELSPGTISVKITHAKCPVAAEQKLTLKLNDRLNVVMHAELDPVEASSGKVPKLALLTLPHTPSPGKYTFSLVNCDAMARPQTLTFNGNELTLPPLQPMHLTEVGPAASYALTSKGQAVMAPYEPLTADHAYLIVYSDFDQSRLNGIAIADRKLGTDEEEMDLKKKEVAQRIAHERKAAEWVLKELERKRQERADARSQRQRQRSADGGR